VAGAVLLVVIGTSIWVLFDAPSHQLSRTWALGCLALWIVAFPWYLATRSKAPHASDNGLVMAVAATPPPPPPPRVAAPTAPPGWHPDPWGEKPYRFWDGSVWTHHTSDQQATPPT
jgi:4-amino-4-deoxy-L-arabinose transferase-like glycosyltransferase